MEKTNTAAFILSAGYGRRMEEYTQETPKPLLKIYDIPMLSYSLYLIRKWGIKDIYLNTFYLHEKIEDFFSRSKLHSIFNINLIHENRLLGTAGGLKNAYDFLKNYDYVILLNSDIIFFPDESSSPKTAIESLRLKPEENALFFLRKKVENTGDQKERSFQFCKNKKHISLIPGGSYIYIGYSILTKKFLSELIQSDEKELGPYLEKLPKECSSLGKEYTGIFHSIGNKKEYEAILNIQNPLAIIPEAYQKDWDVFIKQFIKTSSHL